MQERKIDESTHITGATLRWLEQSGYKWSPAPFDVFVRTVRGASFATADEVDGCLYQLYDRGKYGYVLLEHRAQSIEHRIMFIPRDVAFACLVDTE